MSSFLCTNNFKTRFKNLQLYHKLEFTLKPLNKSVKNASYKLISLTCNINRSNLELFSQLLQLTVMRSTLYYLMLYLRKLIFTVFNIVLFINPLVIFYFFMYSKHRLAVVAIGIVISFVVFMLKQFYNNILLKLQPENQNMTIPSE